jgi:hypothetical protein
MSNLTLTQLTKQFSEIMWKARAHYNRIQLVQFLSAMTCLLLIGSLTSTVVAGDGTSVSKHHQFVAGLSLNIAKDDDGDQANIDILLTLPTVALNQLVSGLRIAKDDDYRRRRRPNKHR